MTHLTPEELELAAKGGTAPAHLEGCAECRAALANAKGRQQLLRGLKPYTLGDDAFRRAEANILARAKEKPGFDWRMLLPLGLAAAAAVAFFVSRADAPKPAPQLVVVPRAIPQESPRQAPRKWPALTVALASAAERKVDEAWVPVFAGDKLQQETELKAARLVMVGELLLLDGAPVRVLSADAVASVDGEGGRLDLDGRGHENVVRVGPRWFKSTDAAYLSTRAAAAVDLDVRRGEVWVADDASFARAVRVVAPARLRFDDGQPSGVALAGAPAAEPAYRPRGGMRLDLIPRLPLGERVSLEDQSLGGAPLSLMLPPGRHKLRFFQGEKLVGERWVLAQDGSAALEEPKAQAPKLPVMPAEEQQRLMALAINAQKAQFSGCYEKWLKNDGKAGGGFAVAVTITERGKVKSANVRGAVPEQVAECVRRTATGFKFPAVGEEVELEIPVRMVRP
jgi:hypothetical protein